jgi:hypothetical protein
MHITAVMDLDIFVLLRGVWKSGEFYVGYACHHFGYTAIGVWKQRAA